MSKHGKRSKTRSKTELSKTPVNLARSKRIKLGKADESKSRRVNRSVLAGGMNREAGMMIDGMNTTNLSYTPGFVLEGYRNSYASGLGYKSGTYDIPTFVQVMNQKNGGIIQFPMSLQERYSLFRYYARCFTNPNVLITKEDGTEHTLISFKAGDRVINCKGEITEVKEVTCQKYEGNVVRLGVEGNLLKDLETTPEHPFYVLRSDKFKRRKILVQENGISRQKTKVEIDFSPEWVEAKDLNVGDFMIVPKIKDNNNIITIERSRLIGYYLSEGHIGYVRGKPSWVNFSLGSHEKELIEEIKSLCFREFGKEPSVYWYEKNASGISLRLHNPVFAKWLVENCGELSHAKTLSEQIFRINEENAKHIIACWLNGDGTISYNSEGELSGVTVSKNLADQLYLMMVRVGLTVTKITMEMSKFNSRESNGSVGWKLIIPPFDSNKIMPLTKYLYKISKEFRYRKFNYNGNMLLPIRNISTRIHNGLIWNLSTIGEKYEDRTFMVYGMATHNTDSLVGRALDLLSDLPMSKISLHMPKHAPEELRDEIKEFFEDQVVKLDLFNNCSSILYELNCIGGANLFVEWDEENKRWERIQMLPPEEVFSFEVPFSNDKRIEYRPRNIVSLIKKESSHNELEQQIIDSIPQDIKDSIVSEGCILLDSNPLNGSFCHTIARRKAPYMDLSASLLDRVLVPLQLKDYYKYTQLSLASRNMTPKNLVTAVNCSSTDLDQLRTQVDLAYNDPDYTICTNFDVKWETIGSRDRLLELSSEYERLDNEIFSAMGVTRELLTGEGSYSGTKITVEILNTMFLRAREILVSFIEQKLFLPICEKRGWYSEGKNGIKKYFYPQVGFNRLTIRDNSEVFENMFQLYQKGSLPVEIIYDLFNLDTTEIDDKLYKDLFTVRDSTFNEFMRNVLGDTGRKIAEGTDVKEKISKYLRLKTKPEEESQDIGNEQTSEGEVPIQDLSSLLEGADEPIQEEKSEAVVDKPTTEQEKPSVETILDKSIDIDDHVDEIVAELSSSAEPEEIMGMIIKKEKKWDELTQTEKDAISDLVIRELPDNASDEDIISQIVLKSKGVVK